jgi:hypothetical protein
MRIVSAFLVCALALTAPALAQPAPAAGCAPRSADLGGIGRASVVAFTGAIFGDRVCATVANLPLGTFSARIVQTPSSSALVDATIAGAAANAILAIRGAGDLTVVPSDAALGAVVATSPVGPFLVTPGGALGDLGANSDVAPRVVLAFAGQRLVIVGTTPVALADLARALRDEPDLFGIESVERAVVLATGAKARLTIHADGETLGTADDASGGRILELTKQ